MVEGVVKSSPYGLVYAKLGIIYVKTGNFVKFACINKSIQYVR